MEAFFKSSAEKYPDLAPYFLAINEFQQKKLWFQLSQKLLELIHDPLSQQGTALIDLYEQAVKKFEEKLRPLSFVQFTVAVASKKPDADSAIAFLDTTGKVFADDAEASLLCKLEIMLIKIKNGKAEECKADIEEAKQTIENSHGVMDGVVHSTFYRAAFLYHKALNNPVEFYNNSLLYLAYTPLELIPLNEQIRLAYDVGLSALISDKVYNFGELLQHPIIQVLENTEHVWLYNMLFAFNAGDIVRFESVSEEKGANQDILRQYASVLNRKIRIMCLMEMVFKKPSEDRTISFKDISDICRTPINEVERLLMKAFSINVMKGRIDEVNQTVQIKWVQPRVLNKDQIANMNERLQQWAKQSHETTLFLESSAPEIFSS